MLIPSFPRYLFLRLHEHRICEIKYSDLIWEETARNLREGKRGVKALSESKIAEIHGHIEEAEVQESVLDTEKHRRGIDSVRHINDKDRHVLYLAFVSKSKYLVTQDTDGFRLEDINHNEHMELEFYFPVEAVSFDDFLCALAQGEKQSQDNFDDFLAAVVATMVYMWDYSVEEIFCKLNEDELCPKTYKLLLPHFEKIRELVEEERRALS